MSHEIGEAPSSEPRAAESPHGGVTLADLILIMASGWALPFAVRETQGVGWPLAVAFLVAVPTAILWTWYCKNLEWHILRRVTAPNAGHPTGAMPPIRLIVAVYLVILGGTLAVQYGLYRGLIGVLRA